MPRTASGKSRLHRLGCVVSGPSDSFARLLDRLLPSEAQVSSRRRVGGISESIPIALSKPRNPEDEGTESDLPRSRELQPPAKLEAEENLPYFRIRLKQIGGPRTRIMTIQARSATQAERRALEEIESIVSASDSWGVLHVAKVAGGGR